MISLLETLQNSEFSQWVLVSVWGYPILLTLHSIGLALLVGLLIIKNTVLNDAPRLDAEQGAAPVKAKALAAVSILMWISAIGFGRYMAYE